MMSSFKKFSNLTEFIEQTRVRARKPRLVAWPDSCSLPFSAWPSMMFLMDSLEKVQR